MASPHTIERHRGTADAGKQFGLLREKWPLAFPVLRQDVRPLAMGAVGQIAEAMGWTISYTRGVLTPWKMSAVYCQAVLAHDQRIALDGTPAEPVDAEARDQATKRLAQLKARAVKQNAKKTAAAKTKPAPTPDKPAQLRDQVRADLLRRRA
jgi:sRNA-binding protein